MAGQDDTMGQFFFDDGAAQVIGPDGNERTLFIPKDTILINTAVCTTPEMENSTILHECVHKYLDLPFFLLQCMAGREFCSYLNRKKKRKNRRKKTAVDWMEMQAEKMPTHLMMEKDNTIFVIEKELRALGGTRSPENMRKIMMKLTEIFQVSKAMARVRMKQLGYAEAEGIYNFIDHQFVPDHGCSGDWPSDITYTLSPAALAHLSRQEDFLCEIEKNRYIYVEGHLCRDEEKYIDRYYGLRLSAYARCHIDECCMGFSIRGFGRSGNYEDGIAARKKRGETALVCWPEVRLRTLPEKEERREEYFKDTGKEDKLWADIMLGLPNEFRPAVNYILKKKA